MNVSKSLLSCGSLCSWLLVASVACAQTPAPPPPISKSQDGTQVDAAPVDPAEASMAQSIILVEQTIPENLKGTRDQKLIDLQERVDRAIEDGRAYHTRYPDGEHRTEVLYATARLLVLNNQRELTEVMSGLGDGSGSPSQAAIQDYRNRYFGVVQNMLAEARGRAAGEIELLARIDRLRAQCYYFTGEFDRATDEYRAAIKNYPTDPDPDQTLCALISSALKAGTMLGARLEDPTAMYQAVIDEAESFIQRYPTSEFIPHILHMKAKGYMGLGKTGDAYAHFQKYDDAHRKIVSGNPIEVNGESYQFPTGMRREFESYLDQLEFYYGFLKYIDGDIAEARRHFQRAVDFLGEKGTKSSLLPASQVFQTRTLDILETIDTLQGKPAPALNFAGVIGSDPTPANPWIDEALDLEAVRGNVVVMLFAAYGTSRYDPFSKALEDFYQKHWHEGFRAAWITYPKGRPRDAGDLASQKDTIQSQRRMLGLSFPTALDLSEQFATARSYNASVGGANLYAIDRQGNVAWFKIDPTERDLALAYKVFERLLAE